MKNMLLIPLLFTASCSLFGSSDRFPEVWVVPEIKIRIAWPITAGDPTIDPIKDLLEVMNNRIYDATDGQVRIEKFTVYAPSLLAEQGIGTGNIIPRDDKAPDRGHASVGDPKYPGFFFFQMYGGQYTVEQAGSAAAHEWFHAFGGMLDEYKRDDGSSAKCPESIVARTLSGSCIMYSFYYSELCRPETHSKKTQQNDRRGMSCYEWFKKTMGDTGKGTIQIPDKHLIGPIEAPAPIIEFKFN